MEKIYYDNRYVKEFTAEIVDIKEFNGKFHVLLNQTSFFPGGGGQNCDLGFIDNHAVIDVYEKDEEVYHVVETKPIKIHKVKCVINWDRRTDGMHQHLAQHVLSGCFFNLFNANTFAIHLGSDVSTVDIYGILTEEQIREAEKLANKTIGDALPVDSFVPSKAELKKLNIRRSLPNTKEDIRIVKIGDFDINACCGLHPASTQDLRLIKIRKFEKHKEGTRIEFLAGTRAVEDSFKKDEFQSSICKYLNCNENEAINGIKNLSENLKEANETNKSLNILLAKYQVKEFIDNASKIGNFKVIKQIFDGENLKYVNNLTSKLIENDNTIALMAVKSEDKVNLIFACTKGIKEVKMNDLLKDAISLIDGKGGGSPFQAQGAGKNNANLESALDYAYAKIQKSL
ncbi:alanyl-tRNA editing protein [Clostridium saccharobutylicum]|uniref:Alanine--tRNA ligase n=1 Tax=Clostridium saccharobutylicum DSM 13864 TaxID=1345695 RepID=U5MXB1_CLOSA|nr:DHHA1 domain-containing protein [Clostridium saccharobutylicum]AGX45235.1 alanyl-tRNA editing protein AlaX-L [Clostridium saccharobutylicum DSM 13864]AQR92512.1 alanine--tRNA ligase [Clostridium saccharobutylicum]AQS02415.1 alanine--tRNA ligase [Clostridium saccharobutylicum]AQS16398.1 alanine--tRNA ligase [Clostridium saccharobutylicum]MBA2905078.1 alanyl-tRNA synthetase [Clostridium saccharobutylicum]